MDVARRQRCLLFVIAGSDNLLMLGATWMLRADHAICDFWSCYESCCVHIWWMYCSLYCTKATKNCAKATKAYFFAVSVALCSSLQFSVVLVKISAVRDFLYELRWR